MHIYNRQARGHWGRLIYSYPGTDNSAFGIIDFRLFHLPFGSTGQSDLFS